MKNQNSKTTFQNGKQSKEKAIEVLNSLITINNDRIEGYETASNETDEEEFDLKTLFAQFISTSQKCKQELVMEVNALKNDLKHLSAAQQNMIYTQKSLLKADHNHIKALRDALADA